VCSPDSSSRLRVGGDRCLPSCCQGKVHLSILYCMVLQLLPFVPPALSCRLLYVAPLTPCALLRRACLTITLHRRAAVAVLGPPS
jgi:hypothetical protein